VSATFVIFVHEFPHGEVSVKVGLMEFGHNWLIAEETEISAALWALWL